MRTAAVVPPSPPNTATDHQQLMELQTAGRPACAGKGPGRLSSCAGQTISTRSSLRLWSHAEVL